MIDGYRPWALKATLTCCTLVLASCGGGVSSSSSNTLTSGSTTTPVAVGSPNITVTAANFVQASNGELNSIYTCPTNTTHQNPSISWTAGPAGTAYYVVVLDEPDEVLVSKAMATHWLLRTGSNTLSVQGGLTTVSAGIASSSSTTRLTSNLFQPPVQRDQQSAHPYNITVYAMSGSWLIDPINGGGPGDEFSDAKLPQLNSYPSPAGNYYFSGTGDTRSFDSLFGSNANTSSNYILGRGVLTGNINQGTAISSGC